MSELVYGTCAECGRERVPGRFEQNEDFPDGRHVSNFHRMPKGSSVRDAWGYSSRWCGKRNLIDAVPRGTLARPLPASELNLKQLSDDQLQALFERVESEMVRRAEEQP